MKRVLLIAFALVLAPVAWSQTESDFQTWMKSAGATTGSLKKHLDAKEGEAAAADARKLQSIFNDVQKFFEKNHSHHGGKHAVEAADGFDLVAKNASEGHFEEATAAFKTATAACGECHSMHREKAADGTFKIKY